MQNGRVAPAAAAAAAAAALRTMSWRVHARAIHDNAASAAPVGILYPASQPFTCQGDVRDPVSRQRHAHHSDGS
jgi:hypothetical protein